MTATHQPMRGRRLRLLASLSLTLAALSAQAQPSPSVAARLLLDKEHWEKMDWSRIQSSEIWNDPAFTAKPTDKDVPIGRRLHQTATVEGATGEIIRHEATNETSVLRRFTAVIEGQSCATYQNALQRRFGPAEAAVTEQSSFKPQAMETSHFALWRVGATGVALECSDVGTPKERFVMIDFRPYDPRLKPAPTLRLQCEIRARPVNTPVWSEFSDVKHIIVLPNSRVVTDEQMRVRAYKDIRLNEGSIEYTEEGTRAISSYAINRYTGEIYGRVQNRDGRSSSGEIKGTCMRRESATRAF